MHDAVPARRLEGRVAFVTGAGRGQGRSHALQLAREGADVALVDLGGAGRVLHPPTATATRAELDEVASGIEALGSRALVFEADVRDFGALQAAADVTAEQFGGIDLVVANAGITDGWQDTWDIPVEHWRDMIDINLTGVFLTCKATIPHVMRRPDHGSILLISSAVAIKPVPRLSHYVAAKSALRGLMVSLASELGPFGIRCNSVHPAGIDSEMTTAMVELNGVHRSELLATFRSGQLIPRNVEIGDVTHAVMWLLSDEARYVTGLELTVDAGESRR